MCVVCTDWLRGKMTSAEALRALGEMITANPGDEHYFKASDRIMDKEVPFKESEKEIDRNHEEFKVRNQNGSGS